MRAMMRRGLMAGGATTALAMLAACGDAGGGVQSTPTPIAVAPAPTPTPSPAPSPTPAPTPTPTSYDTVEYRQTLGAVDMNALAAYQKGATGAGIKVGVIDTGIDLTSSQFAGRVSSASANVAGGTGVQDEAGHGTAVAFTIAGARNGSGTHGVAFDSTLIVLRADTANSCATTVKGDDKTGCSFDDDNIAKGVDAARVAGARVVNMSLGGSSPSTALVAAINRATSAGIVLVISAGNDGTANPDPFAEIANQDAVARGLVIIAGSVNAPTGYQNETGQAGTPGALSSFSDKAGDGAAHYLAAVGTRVAAPDNMGTNYLWTGTSFAAPQVSAAVALLAQAFPNLTGAQIVSILYSSARDAGTAGVDGVYGNGILDLTKAFQPLGTSSLAGTRIAVPTTSAGMLSAPMGDARTSLGAVILDGYSRAFATDLAANIRRVGAQPMLAGALAGRTRAIAGAIGSGTTMNVTLVPRVGGDVAIDRTTFSPAVANAARATAAMVTQRLGARATFAFGYAYGGAALVASLQGAPSPAFLVASDPRATSGFDSRSASAAAFRQRLGRWGLTVAAETGDVVNRGDLALANGRVPYQRWGYDRAQLGLDRRVGPLAASLGGTWLRERDTVLGARLSDSLGSPHANSLFADAAARVETRTGWALGGSVRRGWTRAAARLGIDGAGTIQTGAWSADLGKEGLFGRGDTIGLRVAQPLRVSGGGIDYRLPSWWDYASNSVGDWSQQRLNLSPTGRELDVEARYARPFGPGDLSTNLFWRRDPGNVSTLAPDYGLAVRYGFGF